MSGQLSFLTSELQALSKEAGRRHGDVKEAADKALALLRTSPESALSDLHDAEPPTHPGPSTTGQAYPVLLAPIVLGCGTKNTKVISIAVGALQRLSGVRGAITETTVPLILQTLRTVLSQGVEIQLKILQTLVSLLTNCKDIHNDMLAETLLISFRLQESKIGVVSSTAAATLRQLIMFVFENVDEEDKLVQRSKDDSTYPGPVPTDFTVRLPTPSDPAAGNAQGRDIAEAMQDVYLLPSARDAYLVFEDICLLVNSEQPSFLKLQSLPRTFGLELIESVLSDFSPVFARHAELLHLLRTLLSPLLIRALAEKPTFSTTLRLMRVMYLLLKKFNDALVMEAEIFLSMFIKIVAPGDVEGSGGHPLSSGLLTTAMAKPASAAKDAAVLHTGSTGTGGGAGSSPAWMRVLALEILRGLCGDFDLLRKVWTRYDGAGGAINGSGDAGSSISDNSSTRVPVFRTMITAFNRLATEKPHLLGSGAAVVSGIATDTASASADYTVSGVVDGIVGMAQQAASSVGVASMTQGGLSTSTASVKLQCIDQLDKADAPVIPETYIFLLALQCLNAIADGFASSTLPVYSSLMNDRPRQGEGPLPAPPALDLELDTSPRSSTFDTLRTTKSMADAGWPALLASLSFYLTTNLDDDLFTYTLSAYQNFTTTCGVLNLKTPRDAFLISLCKFAVPPAIVSSLASLDSASIGSSRAHQPASMLSAGADALGLTSQQPQALSLSTRNLLCLRSLVGVSQALAGSLQSTWFYVFEALQNADYVLRADATRRQNTSHKKRSAGPPSGVGSASHGASTLSSPSKSGAGSTGHTAASSSHHGSGGTAAQQTQFRFVPSDAEEQASQQRTARLFEVSRSLDDDAFQAFVGSLCRLNGEMIGIPASSLTGSQSEGAPDASLDGGMLSPGRLLSEFSEEPAATKQPKRSGINVIRTLRPGEKSYAVTKLGEVTVLNMHRLISRPSSAGWDVIVSHLLVIQHWQHAPANVRLQAAEVFDKVISAAPRDVADADEGLQRRVQEQTLRALSQQAESQPGSQTSTDADIRKAALDTLFRVLEGQGHALVCGWSRIFDIVGSACPPSIGPAAAATTSALEVAPTTTSQKSSLLVRVAFPSLQLICSDFLAALSPEELEQCIKTLRDFGKQTEDVNVALTAGGLLWQVSDHLQVKRRSEDATADRFLALWMYLLRCLLELCDDRRQEARDGAIQILWRSIELYGSTLGRTYWEKCIWDVIFPLLDALDLGIARAEEPATPQSEQTTAMGVPLLSKQWDDSKILAISSVGSVFASELSTSLSDLPSIDKVTTTLIAYLQRSFASDRSSVATAAMKCLDRILCAHWEVDKRDKAQAVAETAWRAWTSVGQDIMNDEIYTLSQANLEAYARVAGTLQQKSYLYFDDERCIELLRVLKAIITYPYSPDYRPDQDVLPPVQAAAMETLYRIELGSDAVISAVLQDLAEYMSLAFTRVSDVVKSPVLAEGHRKQNQKITYVALSKASTTKVVEVYHRFKSNPSIYAGAAESVLAAYSIPLRLKYECPSPSKFGEDQPLWKTATLHFLQLARSCVDSLDALRGQLDADTIARIWRKVVAGFQAILQADCRPVLEMELDDQRAEEDFDLAVIVTIEMHILPRLGSELISDDAITALARAVRDGSRLHETTQDTASLSPAMTLNGSADSFARSDDRASMASSGDLDGTTVDEGELPRERFAYWCFDLLFLMCQRGSPASVEPASGSDSKRVAALTLPLLLARCQGVIRAYLADASLRGRLPFTRLREEELVYTLRKLLELDLDEGVFLASRTEDPTATIRSASSEVHGTTLRARTYQSTRMSARAHLFELYPLLLSLVALPRSESASSAANARSLPYPAVMSAKKMEERTAEQGGLARAALTDDARELARKMLELLGEEFARI